VIAAFLSQNALRRNLRLENIAIDHGLGIQCGKVAYVHSYVFLSALKSFNGNKVSQCIAM